MVQLGLNPNNGETDLKGLENRRCGALPVGRVGLITRFVSSRLSRDGSVIFHFKSARGKLRIGTKRAQGGKTNPNSRAQTHTYTELVIGCVATNRRIPSTRARFVREKNAYLLSRRGG